jgi:metal-responsive CopG/Arc/MetJ family transcriptional regulator
MAKISISLPDTIVAALDSISPNRSEHISKLLAEDLESRGIYGETTKARLVAAIQSIEGELTEERLEEVLSILTNEEREKLNEEAAVR